MSGHVIFDLDNCVSADAWRIKYIRWDQEHPWDRYEPYHRGCGMDSAEHIELFREVTSHAIPVFLTGRPLVVRPPTIWWLKSKLGVTDPILIMRNNDDHRPSVKVKKDMLKDLFFNWDIVPSKAYDDRPEIVQMYRDAGIEAEQLYIIDPDAAYKPPEFHLERRVRYLRWKTNGRLDAIQWNYINYAEAHLKGDRAWSKKTTKDWIDEIDAELERNIGGSTGEYELFCRSERDIKENRG